MNFKQLLQFGLVGAVGFVVDASILLTLVQLGLDYFSGRLISFLCAASCTWLLNRHLVFSRKNNLSVTREFTRYLSSMAGGGAINYGVYSLTLILFPHTPLFALIGVALGSVSGLSVNYTLAKRVVFQGG